MVNEKSGNSYKIMIQGIVQGVGFRPFLFRLGNELGLTGQVWNQNGNVEIVVKGSREEIMRFAALIKEKAPVHSLIERLEVLEIEETILKFQEEEATLNPQEANAANKPLLGDLVPGFQIIESRRQESGEARLFSPDIGLCDACRTEIMNPKNRRHGHYFNACVSCGPRFSIIRSFPYDREHTAMAEFPLCGECQKEYEQPLDRRFHGEAISCKKCGPVLFYQNSQGEFASEEAFSKAAEALRMGKLIAIKGIGGYHLACSPYVSETVEFLREWKGREHKPFAVMFRDIEAVKAVCEVSPTEEMLLNSWEKPIVLLPFKKLNENETAFSYEVAKENHHCGCFLPYTPLQAMIFEEIPWLVMTSANVSGSPIVKTEEEMIALWNKKGAHNIFDGILYSNREIVRRVEDSVVKTVVDDKMQIIRRGRGYVPLPVAFENPGKTPLLALGGDLKAAFSMVQEDSLLMSPFIGDLENASVLDDYIEGIKDFQALFQIKPQIILCDAHPRYFSSKIAKELGKELNIPVRKVFHHHAHIASVMAEHKLKGKVLGIAFDGSGYGEDQAVWGGEFLICQNHVSERVGHLKYARLLGGDEAARDGEKTAACYLNNIGIVSEHKEQVLIKAALEQEINTFETSSMGRLFDAVSSLLHICDINDYEGKCAIMLEQCAKQGLEQSISPAELSFSYEEKEGKRIYDYGEVIKRAFNLGKMTKERENVKSRINNSAASIEKDTMAFALGFHYGIVKMVEEMCHFIKDTRGIDQIALSGGVFQNTLLMDLIVKVLKESGFFVYYNQAVPPNDGGISLGQAYIGRFL